MATIDKVKRGAIFKHFKGNIYIVDEIVHHSETQEMGVVYHNVHTPEIKWFRLMSSFTEMVPSGDERFQLLRTSCTSNHCLTKAITHCPIHGCHIRKLIKEMNIKPPEQPSI